MSIMDKDQNRILRKVNFESWLKSERHVSTLLTIRGAFTEAKARTFRYDFFKQIMEIEDCTALVTGHHANDQAETTLMRLIRGTKLRHLSGIPVRQPFGKGELIRPLLAFTKNELMEIPHFEDSSNHSQDFFRNRVRHQYLTEFEKRKSSNASKSLLFSRGSESLAPSTERIN